MTTTLEDKTPEEIENILAQTEDKLEQLEARDRSIRDLVQDITDSRELLVEVEDVIETKKLLLLECIENYQRIRSLEEVMSHYSTLINLCRFFLKQKPDYLAECLENRNKLHKKYMGWFTEYRLTHKIQISYFSRFMKPEVDDYFYEIVDILLNTKLITAGDITSYRRSYEEVLKKVQKTAPDMPKVWDDEL